MIQLALQNNHTYIMAISGGVDSIVLLDLAVMQCPDNCNLIVAHVDHGIRPTSNDDANLVRQSADKYNLKFELLEAQLGSHTSEAKARLVRYKFLRQLKEKYKATAIITAHHQDDFLETVILNFHRGCNRRGLTSLRSKTDLLRPMLSLSKKQIIDYAQAQQLSWIEDFSNNDLTYLRNYIRHKIMPKLTNDKRHKLLEICQQLNKTNLALDSFLDNYLIYKSYRRQGQVFSRQWFNNLTDIEACEIVATWMRKYQVPNYSQAQIKYIVVKLRTLANGKLIVVSSYQQIRLTKRSICLEL